MSWFSRWFWGSAYDGANQSRHRENRAGVVTFPNDEDRAVGELGRERLRLECRDLCRNNPLASAIVRRFADNVIATGITPQAKTSDEVWNEAAERYFNARAVDIDHLGRVSFWESQRLIVKALFYDGEIFIVKTNKGKLQFVEAERVRSPSARDKSIVEGIKIDDTGIVQGYYVHNRNDGGQFTGDDYRYIKAADVLHIAHRERPDQLRGIPIIAPIINAVRDLDEYFIATLLKAKHEAKNFFFIETEGGVPRYSQEPRRYDVDAAGDTKPLEKVETGQIVYGRKGEKIHNIANETPGSNFVPFTERMVQWISASTGFPAELITLAFGNSSFSGNRTILQQAYRTICIYQRRVISEYCQRVWNWKIGMAIDARELTPAPTDAQGVSEWSRVYWQTPEFLLEDPQTEAQSNMLRITAGGGSVTEWVRKRGRGSASEVFAEKAVDIAAAIQKATEINGKYPGANVSWRDFIATGMPGQQAGQPAQENNNVDNNDEVQNIQSGEKAGNKWLT